METSYLAHHGVKGMHWGVRKQINTVKTGINKSNKSIDAINKASKIELKNGKRGVGYHDYVGDNQVYVHGFNDSGYSKKKRKQASRYARARVEYKHNNVKRYKSKMDYYEDVGKEYITYLIEK